MSVVHDLRRRAGIALAYLKAGNVEQCQRILEADAPREAVAPRSGSYVVSELQSDFARSRRRLGNPPAACVVITNGDAPGAFQFHFSGHQAVVKLLETRSVPQGARGPAIPVAPAVSPEEEKEIDDGLRAAAERDLAAAQAGLSPEEQQVEQDALAADGDRAAQGAMEASKAFAAEEADPYPNGVPPEEEA
ncbi:MAG TPA: hypothetical protein VFT43_07315 [Candidatus Polarisedimenticolia bacterium]|nr:hypothetical protein [Candidatus Polarisedimenticolia bacterium]